MSTQVNVNVYDNSNDLSLAQFIAQHGAMKSLTSYTDEATGAKKLGILFADGINIRLCNKLNEEALAGKPIKFGEHQNFIVHPYESINADGVVTIRYDIHRNNTPFDSINMENVTL